MTTRSRFALSTAPLLALAALLSLGSTARAEIVTKTIDYKDGDTQLQGVLAYDDAFDSARPGVLVLPEWWGLTQYPKLRAKQLARLGYVAFAADMYGSAKTTDDPDQAGKWSGQVSGSQAKLAKRAAAGLAVLKNQEQVDSDNLAAIGYCFGGGAALALAYSGADLGAVVSFHGTVKAPEDDGAKKIKSEVLLCVGAADPMAGDVSDVTEALTEADVPWTMVKYTKAKHAFTNPAADDYGMDGVGYNKRADRQSFAHMLLFFGQTIGAAKLSPDGQAAQAGAQAGGDAEGDISP